MISYSLIVTKRIVLLFLISNSLYINSQVDVNAIIAFKVEDLRCDQALKVLSEKINIPFAFSPDIFSNQKNDIQSEDQSVRYVIESILKEESVAYTINEDQILFFYKDNPEVSISGFIIDSHTGERLIGATIYDHNSGKGSSTNEYGFFSISVPRSSSDLEIRYLGYDNISFKLESLFYENQSIGLSPTSYESEVIVIPDKIHDYPSSDENNAVRLSQKFSEISPALAGESDYVRNSHLLSGINAASDGLGGINVRGGENGQNLFLLDGVPIYIPYHLLGAYSIYNSSAIKSAKVLKGFFPARYGGRLSSIYDVWSKEGNKNNWNARGDINLVIAKLMVEGPIKKNKSSILIAGRLAPSEYLFGPTFKRIYFQSQINPINSRFYDLNTKLNFQVSDRDRLHINFYRGYDAISSEEAEEQEGLEEDENELQFDWYNTVSSFKWNRHINTKWFVNTTATYSTYGYSYRSLNLFGVKDNARNNFFFLNSTSANRDVGIRTDFDVISSSNSSFKLGAGYSHRKFQPSTTLLDERDDETNEVETTVASLSELGDVKLYNVSEMFAYIENQFHVSNTITSQIGLRGSSFISFDKSFFRIEPRISVLWSPSQNTIIRGSLNRLHQYLHLINNIALRLPNDLWIPSSADILPQSSWLFELSVSKELSDKIEWVNEIYYKTLDNLYAYPDDFALLNNISQLEPADYLTKGKGRSLGWESTLTYQSKYIGGFVSYSLADANRQYANQNLGLEYPFEYDHRHQIKLFMHKKWGKSIQASIQSIYFSPNPEISLTAVQSEQGLVGFDNNPEGQKNHIRGEAYVRLDLGLSYLLEKPYGSHVFKFGLFNTTNRDNLAFNKIEFDTNNIATSSPVTSFPILPSFQYTFKL